MVRFSKAMLQDGAKRIFKWLKKGEGLPSYLIMYDMDRNKEYRLTPKEYAGLYESRNIFWIKNGREPTPTTPAALQAWQWLHKCFITTSQKASVQRLLELPRAVVQALLN